MLCQSIYSNSDLRASSKVKKETQYGEVTTAKDKVRTIIFLNFIFLSIRIKLTIEITKEIIPVSFERKQSPVEIPIP